jgi:hypothetical protein
MLSFPDLFALPRSQNEVQCIDRSDILFLSPTGHRWHWPRNCFGAPSIQISLNSHRMAGHFESILYPPHFFRYYARSLPRLDASFLDLLLHSDSRYSINFFLDLQRILFQPILSWLGLARPSIGSTPPIHSVVHTSTFRKVVWHCPTFQKPNQPSSNLSKLPGQLIRSMFFLDFPRPSANLFLNCFAFVEIRIHVISVIQQDHSCKQIAITHSRVSLDRIPWQ